MVSSEIAQGIDHLFFETDLDERGNMQAKGFRVEQGGVATDDAGSFEIAHAARAGPATGWRFRPARRW